MNSNLQHRKEKNQEQRPSRLFPQVICASLPKLSSYTDKWSDEFVMGQTLIILSLVGAFGYALASRYRIAVALLFIAALIFGFQSMVSYIHSVRRY